MEDRNKNTKQSFILGGIKMRQTKRFLVEESGSSLVYTLLVLTVLSILGISIGMVTLGSYQLGLNNRESTSTFYIAESGANLAYAEVYAGVRSIYEDSANQEAFFTKIEDELLHNRIYDKEIDFVKQNGKQPQAEVTIKKIDENNPRMYMIVSKGKIGGKERVVRKEIQIKWVNKGFIDLPSEAALIAGGKVTAVNDFIKGDAYVAMEKPSNPIVLEFEGGFNFQKGENGEYYHFYLPEGKEKDYQAYDWQEKDYSIRKEIIQTAGKIDFKQYIDYLEVKAQELETTKENITDKLPVHTIIKDAYNKHNVVDEEGNFNGKSWMVDGYTLELTKSVVIPNFSVVSGKRPVTIDVGDRDITMVVNNLDISGSLDVRGSGKLTLIVTDKMKFDSHISIKPKFNLVYTGEENQVSLSGLGFIDGSIFITNPKVKKVNIVNTEFHGMILSRAQNLDFNEGDGKSEGLILAPESNIELSAGYHVTGTIVAHEFKMSGGVQVTYKNPNEIIPGISGGNSSESGGANNLISSGPTLEKSEVSE